MTNVVTGLGVVAPNGTGVEQYWASTLAGVSGIREVSRFDASRYPVRLAGEVRGFAPQALMSGRLLAQTDRWTQLAVCASEQALRDAGVDTAAGFGEYDLAAVTASSSGGNEFGQREISRLWTDGPDHVSAYQSIAWFYAATTGQLSIKYGLKGACTVLASEQAGGLDTLAQARRVLRGGARLVLAGGTEAPLSPYALVCQLSTGRLSTVPDPARAYLPFTAEACGYLPGEGGAMLVIEDGTSAAQRPAPHRYGRVAGCAATFDPRPGTHRPPGLRRAIELALADAGCHAADVDVVFADAAGTPELDRAEAEAIAAVFGPGGVPVTAPKTMTGRLYAGGAALDAVAALLSIRDGVIPPTGVTRPAAGLAIDLVTGSPRPAVLRTALVLARGAGGFNSAAVLAAA